MKSSKAENLARWLVSGHPRKWVTAKNGCWDHSDWLALLEFLKNSEFWPVEPNAVGQILERTKSEFHRPREVETLDAFISYTKADKEFVRRLATDLQVCGCRVWFDEWEIGVGDSIVEKIQSALVENQALVVVLSKASVASAWVQKELQSALYAQIAMKNMKVFPALSENCDVPVFLRPIRYADFRTSYGAGFVELRDALGVQGSIKISRAHAKVLKWIVDQGGKASARLEGGYEVGAPDSYDFDRTDDPENQTWLSLEKEGLIEMTGAGHGSNPPFGWGSDTIYPDNRWWWDFDVVVTVEGLRALEFRTHKLRDDS